MPQTENRKSLRLIQSGYYRPTDQNGEPNISYYENTHKRPRPPSRFKTNVEPISQTLVGDPEEAPRVDHYNSPFNSVWMKNAFSAFILLLLLLLSAWLLHLFVTSFFSLLTPAVPPPLNNSSDYLAEIQSFVANLTLKIELSEAEIAKLSQELSSIKDQISSVVDHLTPELERAMEKWLNANLSSPGTDRARPRADRMPDFALESHGGSVISSRCSKTYSSATVFVFGFPLRNWSEGPRTVLQGHPVLLPGKCWAFHGRQGTLLISLAQPVSITSVTLDHLPRYNSPTGHSDSAPRDFGVFGMNNENDAGTLLGMFTYDQNGEPTQTFELQSPSDVYRFVKMEVLTNWGQEEYTCLYRFRVHGKAVST